MWYNNMEIGDGYKDLVINQSLGYCSILYTFLAPPRSTIRLRHSANFIKRDTLRLFSMSLQ